MVYFDKIAIFTRAFEYIIINHSLFSSNLAYELPFSSKHFEYMNVINEHIKVSLNSPEKSRLIRNNLCFRDNYEKYISDMS